MSLWDARRTGLGGAADPAQDRRRHAPQSRRDMAGVGRGMPPELGPGTDESGYPALAPTGALAQGARERCPRVRVWPAVGDRGCCGRPGPGDEGACATQGGRRWKQANCNSRCARLGGQDAATVAGGPGRGPRGDHEARRRPGGPRGSGSLRPLTIRARVPHPTQQDGDLYQNIRLCQLH